MSNSYKYIDNQYTYIDPDTGLLKNLLGITDAEVLLFVESGAVTKRLQELYENPIRINGIANLFQIHEYLFQDLYSWAGKRRSRTTPSPSLRPCGQSQCSPGCHWRF